MAFEGTTSASSAEHCDTVKRRATKRITERGITGT
jgi:hypothetical protein